MQMSEVYIHTFLKTDGDVEELEIGVGGGVSNFPNCIAIVDI